ncbi:DNA/RNA non-specific endonuclease [Bacillus sp. 491mf]|uniref:DNA/RNA non-specific endonuclease n=1 Tax=Bacillus sp. 491mf TaxID=1761755 RepID=UPI0008EA5458|nr:DNA/RNA non-specific endonuclease [Bacillus sp. 491mf]SFD38309.1 DNA/RNA non-specific endonuclease [Bacillus sp. 491mf]
MEIGKKKNYTLKQYKKIEDKWAAALKETPHQKVTVNVAIIYSGNNMRPEKFSVKYTVDGESFSEVINN